MFVGIVMALEFRNLGLTFQTSWSWGLDFGFGSSGLQGLKASRLKLVGVLGHPISTWRFMDS